MQMTTKMSLCGNQDISYGRKFLEIIDFRNF